MPDADGIIASPSDSDLLQQLKADFNYYKGYWDEIYKEGDADMQVVSGNPWPDSQVQARVQSGRLCLTFDEWSQYLNQTINNVRQNKRAIKVTPRGDGANDETAYLRSGIIKGMEYECQAARAYIRCFQNMVERSFGFFKANWKYESDISMNRVLEVVEVPNPKTILIDPDSKEADGGDMDGAFELNVMWAEKFAEMYPGAEIRSFTSEHMRELPNWIAAGSDGRKRVQVVGWWRRKHIKDLLLVLDNGRAVKKGELPKGTIFTGTKKGGDPEHAEVSDVPALVQIPGMPPLIVRKNRPTERCEVKQYISNGLEILDTFDWEGDSIPIYPMFGKEMFLEEGGQPKRVIKSQVRDARDPIMAYCYARTSQVECAGMAPKALLVGYEGQFATNTPWENIDSTLVPYAEIKAKTTTTGDSILPHPQWVTWEPPIQGLEMVAAAAKQAIQSAMGVGGGLYSGRRGQSLDAKSGKALEELSKQEDEGNFHFLDSYDAAVSRWGRDANKLLKPIYGGEPREVPMISRSEKATTLKVGQPGEHPDDGSQINFQLDTGDHSVTISAGPSRDSQRQDANEFADTLVANAAMLPPQSIPKVLGLAVKLKDLGPLGDEMAEAIDPALSQKGPQIPPAIQAHIQQSDQLIQAQGAEIQKLTSKLETKNAEVMAKLYQVDSDNRTKKEIALLNAGQEAAIVRMEQELGIVKAKMQIMSDAHHKMADQEHAKEMSASDQAHQAGMAQQAQQHQGSMASQQMAHEDTAAEAAAERESEAQEKAEKSE